MTNPTTPTPPAGDPRYPENLTDLERVDEPAPPYTPTDVGSSTEPVPPAPPVVDVDPALVEPGPAPPVVDQPGPLDQNVTAPPTIAEPDRPVEPAPADEPDDSTRVQDQWHVYRRRSDGSQYLVFAGDVDELEGIEGGGDVLAAAIRDPANPGVRAEPEPDSDRMEGAMP